MSERTFGVWAWLLIGLGGAGCATTETQKSTGSNWIECTSHADCAGIPGGRCGPDDVCVDRNGDKVPRSGIQSTGHPDAGTPEDGAAGGSGGRTNAGGAQSSDASSGGALVEDTGAGGNGVEMFDGAAGSAGSIDTVDVDCYSPRQNLARAYESDAIGCPCFEGSPGFCRQGVALVCQGGRWSAVEDGPCWEECWTPDKPDLAMDRPDDGCPCTPEDEDVCVASLATLLESLPSTARCVEGKWTLQTRAEACYCTEDAPCGYGSLCTDGRCVTDATCEVDGMRYAAGARVPSEFTCSGGICLGDGTLGQLTDDVCPFTCPEDTIFSKVCVECGPVGGCALWRTGCLPRCETSADCAGVELGFCNQTTHVCTSACI